MHSWFEVKVKFDKIMEDGKQKKVTELYLFDALSFTEAESLATEELKPLVSGDLFIEDIKRAKLSEVFLNELGDRYYKVTVNFITLDEKSGAEKKTKVPMLVQASSIEEAKTVLDDGMKGTMADYTTSMLKETEIIDVYPFFSDNDENEKDKEELEDVDEPDEDNESEE
ncbi:hypothetical protein PF672P1_00038 [Parabacteroides phage PF672P1]|nr:hypothetical protein PF672P1_00038 [Parabacteroides phage PF672P1]